MRILSLPYHWLDGKIVDLCWPIRKGSTFTCPAVGWKEKSSTLSGWIGQGLSTLRIFVIERNVLFFRFPSPSSLKIFFHLKWKVFWSNKNNFYTMLLKVATSLLKRFGNFLQNELDWSVFCVFWKKSLRIYLRVFLSFLDRKNNSCDRSHFHLFLFFYIEFLGCRSEICTVIVDIPTRLW